MSNQPTLYRGHLIIEGDPRVRALIPHAMVHVQDGKEYILVPHKLDEHKILRNLGYDISPPILTEYDWPIVNGFPPFDAQKFTAALISTNERCFVLNDLGTGKTRAALFAWDYLRRVGAAHTLLVVAPLSTLRRTWLVEVMQTLPGVKCNVLHGSAEKRRRLLAEPADIYVINHDGVKVMLTDLLARPDIDMIVYDELTAVKTRGSDRWKFTNRLVQGCARVVGMTGEPMPQAPTDVYGQIKLIMPRMLENWSFSRFRDHTMKKITNFKWLPLPDATERVFRLMQPSVRFTRDQCMDLPPMQVVDYDCALSDEQRKLFNYLKKELAAQVQVGEISTANEADKINKLIQIVLGCVYTNAGVQYLDCAPRLAVLEEIIEACHGKTIVFTPYKHSLGMLEKHLSKKYTVATVSGDTPVAKRDQIFARFQQTPEPRVLAAHPQCMSHGLTLTEASTIVWWGLPPSVEIYDQANARISRPGQKKAQYIARIVSTTLEVQRYKQIEKRVSDQGLLLDMVKAQQLSTVL